MRLSAMGDVAMTVPVLRAFNAKYPNVIITVISNPFFQPLFKDIPNVHFLSFDKKGKHKGFIGLLRLFLDLRKTNIDAFADLHNVLRSKVIRVLFALSGKKVAYTDKGRTEKKEVTRAVNKIFRPLPTVFERHAKVFEELGFPIDLSNPTFPEKSKLSPEILSVVGEKTQKWIGIAPFAQHDSKVYPLDLMEKVIDQLAQNPGNKILLFGGGKKEIETLESLTKSYNNVISVAGKLKFNQEIHLISNLDVMLSMDSGNGHIAAIFGAKTITLWGATHPYLGFSPFHQPEENSLVSDRNLYPKLPTSIYGNKKVEGYEDAMRTISPESVVEKVIQ
ncbi:MAG: glycosyltransferase family 9 protein [Flavobacterium sp.]|nr:glycosyltransferase family 9 protein [Flavobacterium sp.]